MVRSLAEICGPVAGAKNLDLGRVAWLTQPNLYRGLTSGRFVRLPRPGLDLGLSPTDESDGGEYAREV